MDGGMMMTPREIESIMPFLIKAIRDGDQSAVEDWTRQLRDGGVTVIEGPDGLAWVYHSGFVSF